MPISRTTRCQNCNQDSITAESYTVYILRRFVVQFDGLLFYGKNAIFMFFSLENTFGNNSLKKVTKYFTNLPYNQHENHCGKEKGVNKPRNCQQQFLKATKDMSTMPWLCHETRRLLNQIRKKGGLSTQSGSAIFAIFLGGG